MRRIGVRWVRPGAAAGMIGAVAFALVVLVLTLAQSSFLRSLGWHPLHAPTVDWPSGLILGPLGLWMRLAFVGFGGLVILFAFGLLEIAARGGASRSAACLLVLTGLALMLLNLPPDPTLRTTPATLSGRLHDLAYVLLGVTLLPALLLLALHFLRTAGGRWPGAVTLAVVALIGPAFVIKGLAFYLFLAGVLSWFAFIGWWMWRFTAANAPALRTGSVVRG